MSRTVALVLGLATVGSLALNAQPHRTHLTRRARLSRPGLAVPRMQNEEEIAELEARLAGLKKAKVRCGLRRRALPPAQGYPRACACALSPERLSALCLRVAGGGGQSGHRGCSCAAQR